ncbi:hypothetical protein B484DRAFT_95884 [Ochromonadaceae sp. CCMP2298]|nr:hypothetical protein B484DRAFT_95884 [Ochromonadaceae sp. CCMP2298]
MSDQLGSAAVSKLHAMIRLILYGSPAAGTTADQLLRLSKSINAMLVAKNEVGASAVGAIQVENVVKSFAQLLASDLVLGQAQIILLEPELRAVISVMGESHSPAAGQYLEIPVSALESYFGRSPNKIAIPGISGGSSRGFAAVAFELKSRLFADADEGWDSNPLSVDLSSLDGTLLALNCSGANADKCAVDVVLQYNQAFEDYIAPWEEVTHTTCYDRDYYSETFPCRTHPGNITVECPGYPGVLVNRCPILNVTEVCVNAAAGNLALGSCQVREVTQYNLTCSCRIDLDGVANAQSARRRGLAGILTFSSLSATYTTTYHSSTLAYNSNFHTNPNGAELEQSAIVLMTMGVYCGLIAVMAFVSYSRDQAPALAKKRKHLESSRKKGDSRVGIAPKDESKEGCKDEDEEGREFPEEEKEGEHDSMDEAPCVVKADCPPDVTSAPLFDYAQLEAALPPVFRLGGVWLKLVHELRVYHRWAFALHATGHSCLRLAALAAQVLVACFLQAAMFAYTDPADGQCKMFGDERACIQQAGLPDQTLCFWDQSAHACHFRQPDASFQLIIIVAGLSAVMAVPVARLLEWVMLKFSVLLVAASAPARVDNTSRKPVSSVAPSFSLASWGYRSVVPAGPGTGINLSSYPDPANSTFRLKLVDADAHVVAQLSEADRQHCANFINAQPLQLELASFLRNVRNFSDSLTFLGTTGGRLDILQSWGMGDDCEFLRSSLTTPFEPEWHEAEDRLDILLGRAITACRETAIAELAVLLRTPEERSARLLYLLQRDLLGTPLGALLMERKLQRDAFYQNGICPSLRYAGTSLSHGVLVLLAVASTCLCVCMFAYVLFFAMEQTAQRQWGWLRCFVLWVLFDALLISTVEVALLQLGLPLLILPDMARVRATTKQMHLKHRAMLQREREQRRGRYVSEQQTVRQSADPPMRTLFERGAGVGASGSEKTVYLQGRGQEGRASGGAGGIWVRTLPSTQRSTSRWPHASPSTSPPCPRPPSFSPMRPHTRPATRTRAPTYAR